MRGWLGGNDPAWFTTLAHGDAAYPCHTETDEEDLPKVVLDGVTGEGPHQCAGLAIYRANICKKSRIPEVESLPADRESVFTSPAEFIEHHESNAMGWRSWDESTHNPRKKRT